MNNKKKRVHFSRQPLPYSQEDAEQIEMTGSLDYVENFPRPENETGFYLADLRGRPILSWPPDLPKYDPRGNPSSPRYEPWKKAQDSRVGIAGNYYGFKGGGSTPCHSGLERRCLYHFGMNPFVVEVRAQYPEWNREVYQVYKNLNLAMPKKNIITIDFVLTLKIPGLTNFHYHAISVKPYVELNKESVKRRHKKEIALLAEWGCTHEIMTEYSVSLREYCNNMRLFDYMSKVDDISLYQNDALNMAEVLLNNASLEMCDQKVGMASRRFGWSLNEGYRIFAIANFLGYLTVDNNHDLLPDEPLYLI